MKAVEKDLASFITNMKLIEKPFILPREVPTYVAPHKFGFKVAIEIPQSTASFAIMLRPSLEDFFDYAYARSADSFTFIYEQDVDFRWNANDQGSGVSLDSSIITPSGVIKASTSASPAVSGFTHFSHSTSSIKPGFKFFHGKYIWSSDAFNWSITNPDQATMTFDIEYWSLSGDTPTLNRTTSDTVNGVSTVVTSTPAGDLATWRAAVESGDGFAFVFKITNASTIGRVPSGLKIQVAGSAELTVDSAFTWTHRSFFDVISNAAELLRSQFLNADRHCITGLRATLTNTNPLINKGGSIWAAQLPGNSFSRIPGSAQNLSDFLGSLQQRKLMSANLANGLSWSYTPEKLQDLFFQEKIDEDPVNANPYNLPYMVAVLKPPAVTVEGPQTFNLHGDLMVEYLTTDISSLQMLPHPDVAGLLHAILQHFASENPLSENDLHIKEVAKQVGRFVTSKTGRKLIKEAISYGIEYAPMVLAALA